jgi:hypothetical protein
LRYFGLRSRPEGPSAGSICVLEKLGIVLGDGCLGIINIGHIEELIDEIIEDHPRAMMCPRQGKCEQVHWKS